MEVRMRDPKRAPRIKDPALLRLLKFESLECEISGEMGDLHLHHVVYRSQGGDDVRENIICVSEEIHRHYHAGNPWARGLIGKHVDLERPDVACYIAEKLGGAEALLEWFNRHGVTTRVQVAMCACGCGSPAPIAKKTNTRAGYTKGQPMRFVFGHSLRTCLGKGGEAGRGRTLSESHKDKIARTKVGSLNPNWRDERVAYASLHDWLIKNFPKRGVCEECGKTSRTDYAFDHRIGEHTRNRDDYRELCRQCHMRWDVEIGKRGKN